MPYRPGGTSIDAVEDTLAQARDQYARQQVAEAESSFRAVLERQPAHEEALQSLAVICLQSGRRDEAVEFVERLVQAYPEQPLYRVRLATVHESGGDLDAALDVYRQLIESQPELDDCRFNYARLLKLTGQLEASLAQYQECLRRGISRPEEVHTQIGVLLGDLNRLDAAEAALRDALRQRHGYLPALYNLGLLQEERGRWDEAKLTFSGIVDADGNHVDALARLAHGETHSDRHSILLRKMQRALKRADTTPAQRETLHYALGKVLDDCGDYSAAFEQFTAANRLSVARAQPYRAEAHAALVDRLIEVCSSDWLAAIEPVSEAPLVFICGMFRSGSTLLEQVLGAHPDLRAGGEINYFPRAIGRLPGDFPDNLLSGDTDFGALGRNYLAELQTLFGAGVRVIDKRPDNFLYLGLIRGLFPNARILHTTRDPMDTGLSVYTQALAEHLAYANRLEDIGSYWRDYRRLLDHWESVLAGNVMNVAYESLVDDLQGTATAALEFLGLDWHENCGSFHQQATRVRTASVSQVRRELYASSVGRWKHYEQQLEPLRRALEG